MSVTVTVFVQVRVAEALAEELAALAAQLAGEAELCRSASYTLGSAVDGETAAAAVQLGTGWAGLVELIGQGTGAVAATLREAVFSYRLQEAHVSDRLAQLRAGVPVS